MTTRLDKEEEALRLAFPQFRIQDPDGPNAGVIGRMRTNSRTEYTIWLGLGDFPNSAPAMYIIEPAGLTDHNGTLLSMIGPSAEMHLLQPDPHGHPQVCHYNGKFWLPRVSIHKILMKARLWLEAYESHRREGLAIDAYLRHM